MLDKLLKSSADPKKYSLAAKGIAMLLGSQAVKIFDAACSFGLKCVGIDMEFVNSLAEGVELAVYGALVLFGAVFALYGLARKVYLGRWSHPSV